MAVCDLDGDGQEELAVIEPFHGDAFVIYKKDGGQYREIYRYPTPVSFLHAIWGGRLCGENVFLAGCRELDPHFIYWIAENKNGRTFFNAKRAQLAKHQMETVGAELRKNMLWGDDTDPDTASN